MDNDARPFPEARPPADLPRADQAQIGDLGIAQVKLAVNRDLGWVFREHPDPDFGIDGHIEILAATADSRVATGRVLSVQVKGGTSFFRHDDGTSWSVYIRKTTVHYWRLHSLPVLLVLANPDTGECFWVRGDVLDLEETDEHYRIRVPKSQRLDGSARPSLLDLTAGVFATTHRLFGHTLSPEPTFNHSRPLLGRDEERDAVLAAIDIPGLQVVVVGGRGGIGKSRLLIEVARQVEIRRGWSVRWLPGDAAVGRDAAYELPPGPLLLIADDAHRRTDLEALLRLAASRPERVLLVLGTRPWGRPGLNSAIRSAMIDWGRVKDIGDLGELPGEALRTLVEDELGPELSHYAEAVVAATRESTLVALVAARLLRTEQIPLAMLERNETFRHEVLERFDDAVLGEFGGRIDGERARQLLRLVSVTGPVDTNHVQWLESAASFLRVRRSELAELLGQLEEAEVLGRRSGDLRVIPDVLADHLLHTAIINAAGARTHYERDVLDHFGFAVLPELTANLAELDWRLEEASLPAGVFEELWAMLVGHFRESSNERRREILETLQPVAVMQPEGVLTLCEWLIENPEGDERGTYFPVHSTEVLQKAPPLLERVAYHERWFEAAMDLLWRLGRDEPAPGFQQEGELLRRLESLASYHPHKPLWVQEHTLACLERWTRVPGWDEHVHLPLGIAGELLKKEDTLHDWRGLKIVLTAYPFPPPATIAIRRGVIVLLGRLTRGASARGRLAAVDVLLGGLARPPGYLAREVTKREVQSWAPQDLAILDQLDETLRVSGDPLVRITIKDRLAWPEARALGEVRERCGTMRKGVPETDLMLAFRAYGQIVRERVPRKGQSIRELIEREEQRKRDIIGKVANDLRSRSATVGELLGSLADLDARFLDARRDANPYELYAAITDSGDAVAVELVERLAKDEAGLGRYLQSGLLGLRDSAPDAYESVARKAVTSEKVVVRRAYAGVLSVLAFGGRWTVEETLRAERLLKDEDAVACRILADALGRPGIDRATAIRLLRCIRIGGDPSVADAFAESADELLRTAGDWIDEELVKDLLDRLEEVPRFERHSHTGVAEFLERIAGRWPHLFGDFLVHRIEREASQDRSDRWFLRRSFDAVPQHEWDEVWDTLRGSVAHGDILRRIRDMYLARDGRMAYRVADVFSELAGADETTGACLLEWIEDGDPARVGAVLDLLRRVPEDFVLTVPEIAARMVDAAHVVNRKTGDAVEAALRESAGVGSEIRQIGQPDPRAVRVRDTAREIEQRFPVGSHARRLYRAMIQDAERSMAADQERDARCMREIGYQPPTPNG